MHRSVATAFAAGMLCLGLADTAAAQTVTLRYGQAFSALRIQDYKNFLRLHIARDGSLTIYPVKIERVPRRWRDRTAVDATLSSVVPDEPLVAALIEPPIVVPPR